MDTQARLDQLIQTYYGGDFDEEARITTRSVGGRIEYQRVVEVVSALLSPGSRVLDVGGATGVHARWLAAAGHDVTLVDPVAEQVAVAARAGTFRAVVGDARTLDADDASVDAVLLFGPLYHLYDRADRERALAEAARVVRPGGVVVAAGIGRLSAFADRILSGGFETLTDADLDVARTGAWANDRGAGFPGGHFHTPQELAAEVESAGLAVERVIGLEGPHLGALEWFAEDPELERLGLALARRLDELLAAGDATRRLDANAVAALSPHVLVVGRRAR